MDLDQYYLLLSFANLKKQLVVSCLWDLILILMELSFSTIAGRIST